jgi:tRNA A-37 threonylcarbamoyl transferase component Bud32
MRPPLLEHVATFFTLPPMSAEDLHAFRRQQVEVSVARLRSGLPFGALGCVAMTVVSGMMIGPVAWVSGSIVTALVFLGIPLLGRPSIRARPQLAVFPLGLALAFAVGVISSGTAGFQSPALGALVLVWLFAGMIAPLTPADAAVQAPSHVLLCAGVILARTPQPGSASVFVVTCVSGVAFLQAGLRIRERSEAQAFLVKRRLDDANRALAALNIELERRVDEQVAKIRGHARDVDVLNAQLQQRVIDRSRELAVALARAAGPKRAGSPGVGGLINGRVELVRCLSSGGMGEVFEGFDRLTQTKVAVKMILAKNLSDITSLQRFLTEARAAAAVSHPAIARTFEVDVTENGTLFHVMELLEGETLADWMSRTQVRNVGAICRVGRVLAEALAAVHAAGVVHRDVKPSNVMLTPAPPGAKLLDFGIAKLAAPPEPGGSTQAHTILGTPAYMAPEQAIDPSSVSSPADVYSAGVVFYEVLTGLLPHDGTDVLSRLARGGTPPVNVSVHRPELPAALAQLVMSCLAREPTDRPSAQQIALGLEAFVDTTAELVSSAGPIDATAPTAVAGAGTRP